MKDEKESERMCKVREVNSESPFIIFQSIEGDNEDEQQTIRNNNYLTKESSIINNYIKPTNSFHTKEKGKKDGESIKRKQNLSLFFLAFTLFLSPSLPLFVFFLAYLRSLTPLSHSPKERSTMQRGNFTSQF